MIKIIGNDVMRGGEKIGWIEENSIFDEKGKKVGYVAGHEIYDHSGDKRAHLEGNYIRMTNGSEPMKIDEVHEDIIGGSYSDEIRAAIRLFLGD